MAMAEVLEIALRPSVILPALLLLLVSLLRRLNSYAVPELMPWANDEKSSLARFKANLFDIFDGFSNLCVGYDKYSRHGKAFVLPRLNFRPQVVLPPEQVAWAVVQPETILEVRKQQLDLLGLYYCMTTPAIYDGHEWYNLFHEDVMRRDLTRQLGNLVPDIADELHSSICESWGDDTENWREVTVFAEMINVVVRTTNRLFVGLPLCRDKAFLKVAVDLANGIAWNGSMLDVILPPSLRPWLGPLICYPARRHAWKFDALMRPTVEARLADLKTRKQDPDSMKDLPEPTDFLQWLVKYALETQPEWQSSPAALCTRMAIMEFVAIHTTTFSVTHAIFDLSSGPHAKEIWDELRQEVEDVLAQESGRWTKQGLARMLKTDSALRESMRMSGLGGLSFRRTVLPKEGVVLPSGEHVPCGATLVALATPMHTDERFYERAGEYDPFRFAKERARLEVEGADRKAEDVAKAITNKKNLGMVTPSEKFMGFGLGKHSCPGRFFAAQELKILLGYIAMYYEIEPLPERPANAYLGTNTIPPMKTKLRVRRRKV